MIVFLLTDVLGKHNLICGIDLLEIEKFYLFCFFWLVSFVLSTFISYLML